MSTSAPSGEVILRGIGVSPGVVRGKVYVLTEGAVHVSDVRITEEDVETEISRFEEALIETRRQIRKIQENLIASQGGKDATILDAHLMVLDDSMFIDGVISGITKKLRNAEYMVKDMTDTYAEMLGSVQDEYLRERVADIRDVGRRIQLSLAAKATGQSEPEKPNEKHIVVAPDLLPSETAALRKDLVMGLAIDMGSPTSHTAVLARALQIPAIVALRTLTERVADGDEVLMDGNKGILIIRPTPEQLESYGHVEETRRGIEQTLDGLHDKPAETRDGRSVVLSANVEEADEVEAVVKYGARGIGLFRSEYLYLKRNRIVEEDEQAEIYARVAKHMAPDPVIIRTLDIGGDKFFAAAGAVREANPFLGCRSIRLSLLYPDSFKAQLRAILRAGVEGNVKIMYPMISSVTEVIRANELLEDAKRELAAKQIPFDPDIEVGVMIEIPAAALTADAIAEHVKFFSLGTNDLIQYTIAVDRVNERVAYLYEPTHPAVLRLIQSTVDAGHRHGIWVGVCGEMAADPLMTPLLLGLGVDEFSVAPSAVPLVKDAVRSIRQEQAIALADEALSCTSSVEVLSHCRILMREVAPEILELVQ